MTILREGAIFIGLIILTFYALILILKKIRPSRIFLNLSFGLYIIIIISICFFPIRLRHGQEAINNFIPFKTIITGIENFIKNNETHSIISIIGNFILLTPLGLFFNFYIKKTKNRFIAIFLFSLAIETTQYIIGLIIGYNYRCIDIDDLISNVLGGIIATIIFDFIIKKYNNKKNT